MQAVRERVAAAQAWSDGVIHMQIEVAGRLELGIYDNFHPDCVWVGEAITTALLDAWRRDGIVVGYTAVA